MRIELKNSEPVELVKYTNSLLCLADEYKDFLLKEEGAASANESKLYIQKVKSGSIIADLFSLSPGAIPAISDLNNIIAFSHHLKAFVGCLLNNKGTDKFDKKNFENISGFVEPVAEDNSSQINIYNKFEGNVNLVLNIDSKEANNIQNRSRKLIENMQVPMQGNHSKVVLYWFQTRNDVTSQAGYQGIVEQITNNPVKTIMEPEIKE
ncbi:MAG: hypothetical protein GY714_32360 [Desulfobacterales bacterium]|nr:hypothetical protein [Desulfobacterales bacterium]